MSAPAVSTLPDPQAERNLALYRERVRRCPERTELLLEVAMSVAFLATAVAVALLLPWSREVEPALVVALVALYAAAWQVEFEVGSGYTVPSVVVLVPMLFLLPAPVVPLAVGAGCLLGRLIDAARGRRHLGRSLLVLAQAWHSVAPALLFVALGVQEPSWAEWWVYLLAFALTVVGAEAPALVIDHFAYRTPLRSLLAPALWVYLIDVLLAPLGLVVALAALESPWAVTAPVPLFGLLAIFARERRARLDHALELSQTYRGTALLLGDVIEHDHEYTGTHSRDVVELAVAVADELGLDARARRNVEFGALLHDVGKISVPKEIINKPGPLDDAEWEVMKRHTIEGERMLDAVGGALKEVGRIVRASHEHYDGTGYPDGLAGEAIPLEARICSACDAFSAMTTDRSYRKGLTVEAAVAELRANAGTQFDPRVVASLLAVVARR